MSYLTVAAILLVGIVIGAIGVITYALCAINKVDQAIDDGLHIETVRGPR